MLHCKQNGLNDLYLVRGVLAPGQLETITQPLPKYMLKYSPMQGYQILKGSCS